MFNVGDLIIGKANNGYGITNDCTLCIVGAEKSSSVNDIYVFALEGNSMDTKWVDINRFNFGCENYEANYFEVDSYRFQKITLEEWETFKEKHKHTFTFIKNVNYDNILNYFKGGSAMTTKTEAIINLNGEYRFTNAQKEYAVRTLGNIMDEYYHENSKIGLEAIWNTFKENKSGLTYLLSMHPNWNEDAMAIVLQNDYRRVTDEKAIKTFCKWCKARVENWAKEREYKIACCTYSELQESNGKLSDVLTYMKKLIDGDTYWGDGTHHHVTYDGMTYKEVREEYKRINELYEKARKEGYYVGYGNVYVDENTYNKYNSIINFLHLLANYESNIVNDYFADLANGYAEPFSYINSNGKKVGLKATVGQKVSKVVNKFMKYYEFDKIKDMRTETYVNNNGDICERVRDYGWNKQFADFADGINPLEVKRWTIISVNPVDYLTMSFGNGWASCHTLDKDNNRNASGNYEGCYCSGTLSYMLDNCTLIMYTIDENYNGKEFCLEDKINRCNIHVGEDKFIQGRVYPDGRNADKETSIAGQLRAIMQTVLADCVKEANLWKVLKGTGNCRQIASSVYGATNYPDWKHYDDCNVSFLKRNGIELNTTTIKIGHKPICPNCGEEHTTEEYLTCESCRDEYDEKCACCGSHINTDYDNYVYDEDTGNYYCDDYCAEREDCYYCENVNEYHSEWVYEDSYTGDYFYDYHERDGIHIDDFHYVDEENANNDGWIELDGDWYREDDDNVIECPHCGEHTLADRDECLMCGAIINDEDIIDDAV